MRSISYGATKEAHTELIGCIYESEAAVGGGQSTLEQCSEQLLLSTLVTLLSSTAARHSVAERVSRFRLQVVGPTTRVPRSRNCRGRGTASNGPHGNQAALPCVLTPRAAPAAAPATQATSFEAGRGGGCGGGGRGGGGSGGGGGGGGGGRG
jgi:hypothetical protein